MKLGTETGSLMNHVASMAVIGQPAPTVGMGATILSWTDRYAGTIIDVNLARMVVYVREDKATRTDDNGMSDSGQTYSYEPNPNGRLYTFKQAKSGKWEEVRMNEKTGRLNKIKGYGLRIGERQKYHDFSF